MRIALLQHACVEDPAVNLAAACAMARDAAGQGAALIVTQELFLTPYFCRVEDEALLDLAEPIPGDTTAALGALARELGVTISASLFEKRAPGLCHNTSVLIGPGGGIEGRYRKMHIPEDPGFNEKYYFTPGDLGFASHAVGGRDGSGGGRVGMLVCWDQWFPEAARLTAMRGAELLLYPTAIGGLDAEAGEHDTQRDAWVTVQRSHAIANGVFVAACNRVGREGATAFWGSSFVCDPMGRVIAEAPRDEQAVLVCDVDFAQVEETRRHWAMFFRDRRVDAYDGLLERWGE